jgi:hypothetical protein
MTREARVSTTAAARARAEAGPRREGPAGLRWAALAEKALTGWRAAGAAATGPKSAGGGADLASAGPKQARAR